VLIFSSVRMFFNGVCAICPCLSALYTNIRGGRCLTHVGTEGTARG